MQFSSMQNPDRTHDPIFIPQEALPADEVRSRLRNGSKAVRFEYCISFLVATVRRQSGVYLTDSWQERYIRGMGYNVLTLLLGPWGVPWGLIWTARSFWTNTTGGVDASHEFSEQMEKSAKASAVPF